MVYIAKAAQLMQFYHINNLIKL